MPDQKIRLVSIIYICNQNRKKHEPTLPDKGVEETEQEKEVK